MNMTMQEIEIESKPFGAITVSEQQIINFPLGLYGFEPYHEYALIDSRQPPFYWLQSVTECHIAFVVINPYLIWPDYVLDIPEGDLIRIEQPLSDDLLVFSIVTIPDDEARISCNLQGPLIMNRHRRLGVQSISMDTRWKTKHFIMDAMNTQG